MKKVFKVLAITMLISTSMFISALFATSADSQNNKQQDRQFEMPKNMIFGKITAISEKSVTVSLAEMKKPENLPDKNFSDNKKPDETKNDDTDKKERPKDFKPTDEQIAEMKKNLENRFTLTGESKTIDISSANFNDFGIRPFGDKDSNKQKASTDDKQMKEKTYKNYQVGDYIMIELTSETSNTAKSVREAGMMPMGRPKDIGNNKTEDKK